MAKTSSLVGHENDENCIVHNPVPMPPVMAPNNIYPGTGMAGVNTSPGNKKLQVMKDSTSYPDHVLPKGSTL